MYINEGEIIPQKMTMGVKLLMKKIMKGGAYFTKIVTSANSVGKT